MRVYVEAVLLSSLAALPCASQTSGTVAGTGAAEVEQVLSTWSKQTGIVLTQEAKQEVLRQAQPLASQVLSGGGSLSASITATQNPGIVALGRSSSSSAIIVDGTSGHHNQELQNLGTIFDLTPMITRLPTIKVSVQPVPPRDYVIQINGRPYEATEKSLYGVRPGTVSVQVLRPNKAPCSWNGVVQDARGETVIICDF